MLKTFLNIFRVPELRNKVLFTLFMLMIYRIGFHVPIPGVDQTAFEEMAKKQSEGGDAFGRITAYLSIFSGGSLSQSTIFGLGVMPYISASIIFQLLATVVPSLEKLRKEGETGRRKIQEWTRYATVPLCIIQGAFWIKYMQSPGGGVSSLVQSQFAHTFGFWFMALTCLTAGCLFLMWLGEQIDEYGLGNGISLLILAGIVARMPFALTLLAQQTNFTAVNDPSRPIGIGHILFLMFAFVFIIAGSILITQAQRRIPIQQAKHTRGRRVYGGQRQYLPLRVNHGGVMPIIFAQSLMLFPGLALDAIKSWVVPSGNPDGFFANLVLFLQVEFQRGGFLYILTEIVMIYFFSYFWTTVQFQPKEMANQLRDYGSFIPGLRPGKRTADYLEKVMMRMTYVGAAFLCIIAVIPTAITAWLKIDPNISAFLGGTGLLIVVSVALDMVQRIEANLLMRNYSGFLSGPGQKGKRIKGRQY
ncbi:preprotein translocase subunit SecY [Humisphaera borealis]|uniref:Protein translocase subunit SecY n=1 Tax=Humisphaera borealis TaxID=2807512 RepID=A0A7M2WRS3_9BACT|nr:preprotein translocase subunit SecY [Humisphaera borealis]QOV88218.1 preprotein translocase subunit SecY [Humisphaera borealis]